MKIWIDAQLSPALAPWIQSTFGIEASAVRDLKLRDADDVQIFMDAHAASAIVMTKDRDFVELVNQRGTPPQIIWLTCGNTSNVRVKEILAKSLLQVIRLLEAGEKIVEITG